MTEKPRRPLLVFSASDPLELVLKDILGPLAKALRGNHFVSIMTDHYTKVTRAVPTFKTTASHIASLIMTNG